MPRAPLCLALALLACGGAVAPTRGARAEGELSTREEPSSREPRSPAEPTLDPALEPPLGSDARTPERPTVTRLRMRRPVTLRPGASCATPPPPGPPEVHVEIEAGDPPLSEAVIRRVLGRAESLQACGGCAEGLDRLRLRVDEGGVVRAVEVLERGPRADCVTSALAEVRFPEPRYGQVDIELEIARGPRAAPRP